MSIAIHKTRTCASWGRWARSTWLSQEAKAVRRLSQLVAHTAACKRPARNYFGPFIGAIPLSVISPTLAAHAFAVDATTQERINYLRSNARRIPCPGRGWGFHSTLTEDLTSISTKPWLVPSHVTSPSGPVINACLGDTSLLTVNRPTADGIRPSSRVDARLQPLARKVVLVLRFTLLANIQIEVPRPNCNFLARI
jgi:hypothetical protein